MYDEKFMTLAIKEAGDYDTDIPVCAIIVKDNNILSIQTNKKEKTNSSVAHAEILAIQEANKILNSWRLSGCDMYVTLEPCPMCCWAILTSRIENLYFGSYDNKYGAFSVLNLNKLSDSKINIQGGKKEQDCDNILKSYFERIRNEKTSG